MEVYTQIARAIVMGEHTEVASLIHESLKQGFLPLQVLQRGLLAGIEVVGERFAAEELFIPEVMAAARAVQEGLEVLRPRLEGNSPGFRGRVVLGTVAGDIHDIGKNMVGMMLTANGFEVIDLGVDVTPEGFAQAVKMHKPEVVGLSALLTTTIPAMAQTITFLEERGYRSSCVPKVIVGGAPVTPVFAEKIGADLYAANALEAVQVIKKALGEVA